VFVYIYTYREFKKNRQMLEIHGTLVDLDLLSLASLDSFLQSLRLVSLDY